MHIIEKKTRPSILKARKKDGSSSWGGFEKGMFIGESRPCPPTKGTRGGKTEKQCWGSVKQALLQGNAVAQHRKPGDP